MISILEEYGTLVPAEEPGTEAPQLLSAVQSGELGPLNEPFSLSSAQPTTNAVPKTVARERISLIHFFERITATT
jgi:hypothetical protein